MKYACKKETFCYQGVFYPVLNGHLGWYRDILVTCLNQLDALLTHTSKALVIRFDCHMSGYSENNAIIKKFRRRLLKKLRRHYPGLLLGYLWVREIEKAKSQHYHFVFLVDAERIPTANVFLSCATDVWERLTDIHPHVPENPYYLVKRGDKSRHAELIKRVSYLAKKRGKGYKARQGKDYGASRIKIRAANDSAF
ncbi:inovirus Gp2 family protein [Shewanella submarina]|uniref:Inovirus-type Gp2 protein n=1 Tax=Shewanella submarina TaxID=2016376 RepID=A0ABV7GK54_9GAMM|nr:inovirus-type Gp2 protein [Shewanella submarina]MCL1036464.1 inovirus Gp2 family protein [Shewanella submarina]